MDERMKQNAYAGGYLAMRISYPFMIPGAWLVVSNESVLQITGTTIVWVMFCVSISVFVLGYLGFPRILRVSRDVMTGKDTKKVTPHILRLFDSVFVAMAIDYLINEITYKNTVWVPQEHLWSIGVLFAGIYVVSYFVARSEKQRRKWNRYSDEYLLQVYGKSGFIGWVIIAPVFLTASILFIQGNRTSEMIGSLFLFVGMMAGGVGYMLFFTKHKGWSVQEEVATKNGEYRKHRHSLEAEAYQSPREG